MAEELPSLHIDTDWKRQAQEEKKRLAEQQASKPAPSAPAPSALTGAAPEPASERPTARAGMRGRNEPRVGDFRALVQTFVTQALLYLGDLAPAGGEGMMNLDMAKYQLDLLNTLDEKTRGNLSPEEQSFLDSALYEARVRFVNVASEFV